MARTEKNPKSPSKVSQVIQQAKESLRLLETLEKQTIERARTFVKNPLPKQRRRLTNERILTSLRSLGIASRQEVRDLTDRLAKLETEVAALSAQLLESSRVPAKKSRAAAKPATDVFPN